MERSAFAAKGAEVVKLTATLEALKHSLAVIEFSMDGRVLHANENFLRLMKYALSDILGQPHRIFVEDEFAKSAEYAAFWDDLKGGRYVTGEFLRLDREGAAAAADSAGLQGRPGRPQESRPHPPAAVCGGGPAGRRLAR